MPEMDNRIILSSTAKDELEVSYPWYEERSIGLGERFLDVIDNGLQLIRINPERFPKKNKEYREFDRKSRHVYVLRIFHTRRNPKKRHKVE